MGTVCIANAPMNDKLFALCRVSNAWITSLKIQTILRLAAWQPSKLNVAFGKENKGGADRGESQATYELTASHKYQHILNLTPTEQHRRTAGHKFPERENSG